MLALLKFLDGDWEQVRGNLRDDLDHIEAAFNQRWASTFGDANQLVLTSGVITGILPAANFPALTGDITTPGASLVTTLAIVNASVGSVGSSTSIPSFTVNAKGLITAANGNVVIAPAGTLTGATLAANVLASSLTSVGTLTGGATGAGFTVALTTSTITGTLADARLSANVALLNAANSFTLINPLTTIAESWIGPSATTGIYFKSGNIGIGAVPNYLTESNGRTLTIATTTLGAGQYTLIQGISNRDSDVSRVFSLEGYELGNTLTINQAIGELSIQTDGTTAGNRGGQFIFKVKQDAVTGVSTVFAIRGNGRIGAGTEDPQAPWEVSNSTAILARFTRTGSSGGTIQLWSDATHLAAFNYGYAANSLSMGPFGQTTALTIDTNGNVGIGTPPLSRLHLTAGTATANTAPLQFSSGTLETVARAGVVEFLTDDFFATITTGAARKAFVLDDGARLTSGKMPIATTNGRLINLTASSAYTPTNVTTDRAYDANATSIDEISDVLGTLIADLQANGILG